MRSQWILCLIFCVASSTGCRKAAAPIEEREGLFPEPQPIEKREAAAFTLQVEPPAVTLHPGYKERIKITVQRNGYQGAIDLDVRNLPGTVRAAASKVPAGHTNIEIELTASSRATPEVKSNVHVVGNGVKESTISGNFTVMVRDLPFTLHVEPAQVDVPQGGTGYLKVAVKRKDYPGPISIELSPLPANVRATTTTIPAGQAAASVPITAAGNAAERVSKNLKAQGIPLSQGVARVNSEPFGINVLGPPFSLTIDPEVRVPYEGGKFPVKVTATRRDYRGPIVIQLQGLPGGIQAAASKVATGDDKVQVELTAPPGLPAASGVVQALGVAEWATNRQAASPGCKILVEGPPLLLTKISPARIGLVQGSSATCKLDIQRRSYDGPVQVELRNLPPEVVAKSITIPKGQNSASIELTASDKAPLGGRDGIQIVGLAVDRNRLTIPLGGLSSLVEEPFSLIAQPGSIQLKEGAKATLKVKAVRRTYKGSINLAVKNLPAQVTADKATLAEGKDETEIEVAASPTAPSGGRADVHVAGSADTGRQTVTGNIVVAVVGKLFDLAVKPEVVGLAFGEKATIKVVAARKNYKGPIVIAVKNLPNQVAAAAATIPADKNEIDVELAAGIRADAEKKADVVAVGTAVAAGNALVLSNPFQVDLRPGLVELDVEPKILKVSHGTGAKLKVLATRKGYHGPIALEIRNLPKGFKAGRATIPEKMNQTEIEVLSDFTVHEGDTVDVYVHGLASLVDRSVKSPRFIARVTSIGEPPQLEVSVAPTTIQLHRGGSAKLKVNIVRGRKYDGPVHVDLRNLPVGIEASKGLIPKGQTSVDITVTARAGAELGSRDDICAVASPRASLIDTAGKGNFASGHLKVNIVKK